MIEVKSLWNPINYHGELTVPDGADVEKLILRAIRKLPNQRYEDIKYCLLPRQDGTKLVFFELLD